MSDTLTIDFDVRCAPEHAFQVWTSRIGTWWPRDHTVGGAGVVDVVLQPRIGGLLFEDDAGGDRHVWGEVTAWEPPDRLAFRWHLGRPSSDATDVEVAFAAIDDASTRVRITQRGFERLAEGEFLRSRNHGGWTSLVPHFRTAAEKGRNDG